MKVEIFTLCDAATLDAAGKLNILGSFDRLNATTTPVVHAQCALAIKLRFQRIEEGQKRLRVTFIDQDGIAVMPSVEATTEVKFPGNDSSATISLAVNIQQLRLPRLDEEYSIDLAVDDRHEASVPLFVKRWPSPDVAHQPP
jgi:hypothetical protein